MVSLDLRQTRHLGVRGFMMTIAIAIIITVFYSRMGGLHFGLVRSNE